MPQLVLTPVGALSVFWIQDSGKETDENLGAVVMELGETPMLKALWIIVASISGFLIPTVLGSAFFFAIIGVFGLWIAIAGLILAITFAVTTVAFVPAEGGAR
jgi:hypothetical protein